LPQISSFSQAINAIVEKVNKPASTISFFIINNEIAYAIIWSQKY